MQPAAMDEGTEGHAPIVGSRTDRSRTHGSAVDGSGRPRLQYSSHLWVTVLALLYGTGLRRGELERLNVDDFDRIEGHFAHRWSQDRPRALRAVAGDGAALSRGVSAATSQPEWNRRQRWARRHCWYRQGSGSCGGRSATAFIAISRRARRLDAQPASVSSHLCLGSSRGGCALAAGATHPGHARSPPRCATCTSPIRSAGGDGVPSAQRLAAAAAGGRMSAPNLAQRTGPALIEGYLSISGRSGARGRARSSTCAARCAGDRGARNVRPGCVCGA